MSDLLRSRICSNCYGEIPDNPSSAPRLRSPSFEEMLLRLPLPLIIPYVVLKKRWPSVSPVLCYLLYVVLVILRPRIHVVYKSSSAIPEEICGFNDCVILLPGVKSLMWLSIFGVKIRRVENIGGSLEF